MEDVEILLVEDDPKDIELILYALKETKILNKVCVVRDGEEALDFIFCRNQYSKRLISHPPKVMILDLKIPKVDGFEVLKQLKENKLTKSIPLVILTSSKQEIDVVNAYKLGTNSYIQKPVDFEEFIQKIKDVGRYWLIININPPESAFIED